MPPAAASLQSSPPPVLCLHSRLSLGPVLVFKTECCSDDCRGRIAPSGDVPDASAALPDQVNQRGAPTLNVRVRSQAFQLWTSPEVLRLTCTQVENGGVFG